MVTRGQGPNALPWREELAWAAGFFDGEASISFRKDSRGGRAASACVHIHQVALEPLERFRETVGLGKVYGPYTHGVRRDGSVKTIYSYQTNTWDESQAVVAMLWEFLSDPKRRSIRTVLVALHSDTEWCNSARLLGPGAKADRRRARKREYYAQNKHLWGVKNAS